jgi:hypothetical protein
MKTGAIRLKSAVYILPYSEEHHEILQWLISELSSLGGDGALVRTRIIEPLEPDEIINLFNSHCAERYKKLSDGFDSLEQKIDLLKQTTITGRKINFSNQLNKLLKESYSIKKIDFFASELGIKMENRMKTLKNEVAMLSVTTGKRQPETDIIKILVKNREDYLGKTWATRKNPFVDRMASAWLIRKFIDDKAVFTFIDNRNTSVQNADSITFDIQNGDFTHSGDLCTFEVLIISFALKDNRLESMSRIIHDIDLNDDKHRSHAADGVERVLTGIRKLAKTDSDALEKGMDLFETIYASFI